MPFPESLELRGDFPLGTFVPSAKLVSTGLQDVREAVLAPNRDLYVADRNADCVRIYEGRTGRFVRDLVSQSDQLDKPIHLLLSPDGRYLFVGSGGNDSILRHDIRQNSTSVFIGLKSGGLDGPAGMGIATTTFFTSEVVIQKKYFATDLSMVAHRVNHSSRTCRITRNS